MSEHIIDLILESSAQHFISFVQDKLLDVVGPEDFATDHVEHAPGGPDDDVLPIVELTHILP